MKKVVTFIILLLMIFTISSCEQEEFEIALITINRGVEDGSVTEAAWDSVIRYAVTFNKTYAYYEPLSFHFHHGIAAIDLAISKGAKIVVLPSEIFANAVHKIQTKYPEINFVLINSEPHNVLSFDVKNQEFITYDDEPINSDIETNVASVTFDEQNAGFLAGYASVIEGYETLGYIGNNSLISSIRYGIGFIAGSYYAARELSISDYSFDNSHFVYIEDVDKEETVKLATNWYQEGVDLIYVSAGGFILNVIEAAHQFDNKWIIGSDISLSVVSDRILNSTIKGIETYVYEKLTEHFNDSFESGVEVQTIKENMTGLDTSQIAWRFNTFTTTMYESIVRQIINESIVVPTIDTKFSLEQYDIDLMLLNLKTFINDLGYNLDVALVEKLIDVQIPVSRSLRFGELFE